MLTTAKAWKRSIKSYLLHTSDNGYRQNTGESWEFVTKLRQPEKAIDSFKKARSEDRRCTYIINDTFKENMSNQRSKKNHEYYCTDRSTNNGRFSFMLRRKQRHRSTRIYNDVCKDPFNGDNWQNLASCQRELANCRALADNKKDFAIAHHMKVCRWQC